MINTQRNDVTEDVYSVPHSRRHGPQTIFISFRTKYGISDKQVKLIVTPNSRLQRNAWIQTFALQIRSTVE